MMRVLIVEDEKRLADSIRLLLNKQGFEADCAYDGFEGLEKARTDAYDLVIMDVMMPGMNGMEVTRWLREDKHGVPILMLTAKSDLSDRIEGLQAGADYYLTKPFDNGELLACIHALLRRQGEQVNRISCGSTELDLESGSLLCKGKEIRLSAKEFAVMRLLMKSGSRNLSKELILSRVWGSEKDAAPNFVEVYVGFLRKKLGAIGSDLKIVSIRKLGYHLESQS